MKVYVVVMGADDECECYIPYEVYASRDKAESWVNEHQEYYDTIHFDDVPKFKIEEFTIID